MICWAGRPLGRGVLGYVEVDDLASQMSDNNETVEHAERRRDDREEVNPNHFVRVVLEEGSPGRGWRLARADQVLLHRGLGHIISQHSQFVPDPRCAPGRVVPGHGSNEVADLGVGLRPARGATGFPAPVPAESPAVPANNCLRLDDYEGGAPAGPDPAQAGPEPAVGGLDPGPLGLALQYRELLSQGEVFRGQGGA